MPMTALAHRSRTIPQRAAAGFSGMGPFLLIGVAVVVVGVASAMPAFLRLAIAIPAVALIVAVVLKSPRRSVILLLVWLAVLGTVRRLVTASGASGDGDPLLLVAPIVVGLLVVVAARHGAFRDQTRLTKSVLILSGLVVFSALNPLQGGIAVGAGGLLFVMVPLLWFWIGRGLVDDELLSRVLRVIAVMAVAAAVYGLLQVYQGFPRWDEKWLETKGYAALYVGTSVRPFASFSSASEYVGLLSIGIVIWALQLRRAKRMLPSMAALAVLGWALTVASVRGALVIVPIALGMTFAASRGFGLGRTALTGVGALFALGLVVSQFDASAVGGTQTSALVSRQISGLTDPFNPNKSTLPLHIEALMKGLGDGLQNPVGRGLGIITIAGDKFGSTSASTDIDPSDVAIAMGVPGLLAYGAVVFLAIRLAFRLARRRRDLLTLAVLGVALVTLLQWLSGGNYAVAPIPWLLLGWLDRRNSAWRSGAVRGPELTGVTQQLDERVGSPAQVHVGAGEGGGSLAEGGPLDRRVAELHERRR